MNAIKIIVASIALRLSGIWGFNAPTPRELPSSSPLRVASTAWATSNDGLAQNYASNEQRGSPKAKAPLVDSTLLRFLSSEKKSGSVLVKEQNGQSFSNRSSMSLDTPNGASRGMDGDLPRFGAENPVEGEMTASAGVSSTEVDLRLEKSIESQSWLSQYNARKVALKLLAIGVDNEAALRAGKIVQDYALARVTRCRIRKFLQERDALWESGHSMPLGLDRKGIKKSISLAAAINFDVDGVIAVMMEYGLTGNDISSVFSHTPSVAMMRARKTESEIKTGNEDGNSKPFALEETLDMAFVRLLGETLKLRRYDARKVLRASPGLLTSKGSTSAVQVVKLMTSLGSSTNSIARDKTSLPTLLCRSPALIFRLVAFLSSAQLKVPLNTIGPILRQRQSTGLLDAVAPVKLTFMPNACDGVVSKNLTSLTTESQILGYLKLDDSMRQRKIESSYQTMKAAADVLRKSAGIRDFRKILSSHPDVFFFNGTNVHLMMCFLREEVGMSKDDTAKAIQAFPSLLEQNVLRVKDSVEYLVSIEVEKDALPSILRSFPAILLLDVEKDMVPVVSFLRGIGVRNIGRFVTRLPPVLGYSVKDDLQPKWDFLKEVCQFDYFEVVRFPAYFSYPLERVIKMRYEYLRDCKGIPIQLARVDDVLRFGDRDFATDIALDDDDGVSFAQFINEHSDAIQSSIRSRRKLEKRKLK